MDQKATKKYHRLLMNHELSSFFQMFSPFSDETYHQLSQRVPQKCTAGVDQMCFTPGHPNQKLLCCHTFWIYNDMIII